RERRALAHRAVDGQVAAHGPREPAGEREPEPDALLPQVARVELLEQLEDALARVRGNARPRVADADADGVGARDVGEDDDLAAVGELERVREQVLEDDPQLRAFGQYL